MPEELTENNLFKIKLLRNILLATVSIAAILALYNVLAIYPSFSKLLTQSTKNDAIRATRYLSAALISPHSEIQGNTFNNRMLDRLQKIKSSLALNKFKIYSISGRTIYSTDPSEMGKINKKPYFHAIVAKGKVYTRVVAKDSESLEGRKVTADVVETYVPLMNKGSFLGAFEIYYDITHRKKQLDSLLLHATVVLISLTAGLLAAIIIIFFKESRMSAERKKAEAALRESEEKLNRILNSIPDFILLIDRDLNIVWSNWRAIEFFGEEISGKKCCLDTNAHGRPCIPCNMLNCFKNKRTMEHEIEITDRNGNRMFFGCTATVATQHADGRPKLVLLTYRDITEKKLLQAETLRACQLASIGELAAGVAHEINNPINGIINCAQMLFDSSSISQEQTEISSRIMKAGERIAMIVRSLLSFARNQEEKSTPVHVREILSDCLDLTATQIRKDGTRLIVDMVPDLPMIHVRSHQIQQVFLNLISNARYALNQKFAGEDKNKFLKIVADTHITGGACFVHIVFFDQGTGIPVDLMDRISHPFFSTKPPGEGTGLGLSISQAIIQEHGGRLQFESQMGQYTTVTVELPAAAQTEAGKVL